MNRGYRYEPIVAAYLQLLVNSVIFLLLLKDNRSVVCIRGLRGPGQARPENQG